QKTAYEIFTSLEFRRVLFRSPPPGSATAARDAPVRLSLQFERAQERREQLSLNLEEGAAPLEELRMKLEELLDQRMAVEEEMQQDRKSGVEGKKAKRGSHCNR